MNKPVYTGIELADLHFGTVPAEIFYKELEEGFIKYAQSLAILDFIFIAGDFFDCKMPLNSDHTKYALMFFKHKLIPLCKEKNTKLRIIKGTRFHDNDQLDILELIGDTDCDIKIFDTVSEEELFNGVNVLYIPEEYIADKDEYYKEYFTKEKYYDMIVGHGLFGETAFAAKNQESEVTMSKAPIFNSKDIARICKGPIFFGHIHTSKIIRDQIYYIGSYSRWVFGEEEPKGFTVSIYTPDTGKYKVEFVENKLARKYDTMVLTSDFYKDKADSDIAKEALDISLLALKDKLRVIYNIDENHPNPSLLNSLLVDIFGKQKEIKLIVNNNSKEQQKKNEMDEKLNRLKDIYDFIFNKSIPIEEKLSQFIKIKSKKDIHPDKIREYLYDKLNV